MNDEYYVYIMSNSDHAPLYTGMTNDLRRRIGEHKRGQSTYTSRFRIDMLVYYETVPSAEAAEVREQRVKRISRAARIELIEGMNPDWRDLYGEL